jgi:hypothetical protein
MDDRPLHTGALLRSGDLYRLAAATVRATRAGAISRIVDLGWAAECEQMPPIPPVPNGSPAAKAAGHDLADDPGGIIVNQLKDRDHGHGDRTAQVERVDLRRGKDRSGIVQIGIEVGQGAAVGRG